MKIVVLGGTGFLGSSLARQFCKQGLHVTTVSRSPMRRINEAHWHIESTMDNSQRIGLALSQADFIFHAASDTIPATSKLQPSIEATANITATLRFLEIVQDHSQATLVYISSGGAIYKSDNSSKLIKESHEKQALSYYGAGKLAIESFISTYAVQRNARAIILRPSNVYGHGQLKKASFGLIPTIFDCIDGKRPLEIWGDGTAVRDYLHIDDFVSLCSGLISTKWERGRAHIYNAGSGCGHSVLEICNMITDITGKAIDLDFQPPRGIDIPAIILDASAVEAKLGWHPQIDIHTGLSGAWEWKESHR